VEAAGTVIDEIVTSVQRANELIGTIATASAEQSAGVSEINRAIVQLESVTQENAALVETAAASSHSFQQEAARLHEVVARFQIAAEAVTERRFGGASLGVPRLA
jgi:methyl-accepting chemotaxis protein